MKKILMLAMVLLLFPLIVSAADWNEMTLDERREDLKHIRPDISINESALKNAKSFSEYWRFVDQEEEAEAKKKEEEIKSKGVTEGIGGLRWGDTIEEFSRLRNPSPTSIGQRFDVEVSKYISLGRRFYTISGIGSHLANYHFYKNKFYYFSVNTNSEHGEMIKQALISKYGQPKEISPLVLYINPNAKVGTGYGWEVRDVTITLNINNMKNESHLSYIHTPTLKLRISDDKKTSEEMKKDL